MKLEEQRFETLRIARRGSILEITIDNPKSDLNAVDGTLHAELAMLFRELRSESEARAVVLTGSKRAFCAGEALSANPAAVTAMIVSGDGS
jgi:enoyl-CoA hydratase